MNEPWTEKYLDLMAAENFEEAIALKNAHFPESFYKFRSLTERTLSTIKEDYVWLSEIEKLNDPFECSIQFDNDACLRLFYQSQEFQNNFRKITGQQLSENEIKILTQSSKPYLDYLKICETRQIPIRVTADEQIKMVQHRWNEIAEESNKNLRICSFSLTKESLLLWSHYADEHRGVCIEYDFQNEDTIRAFLQPVIYKTNIRQIGIFEQYTTMQMIASSLVKAPDWQYEKEWRLTIFKQRNAFPQKLPAPLPKAIYLGTRFQLNNNSLKEQLFEIAEEKNIAVFEMTKHPQQFKLVSGRRIQLQ